MELILLEVCFHGSERCLMDSSCYNMGMNGRSSIVNNRKVLHPRDIMVGHMLYIKKMILCIKCDKDWLNKSMFLRRFTMF